MKPEFVKVAPKLTADTFGCEEDYFNLHIRGKALRIVHSTFNHYVRVQDENQEEWGLFPGQYAILTGLGDPPAIQSPEVPKKKLFKKQA